MAVILEVSGNTTRQGFVSRALALWMTKKLEEVALMAEKKGEVKFFERIKYLNSYLHVFVRNNGRSKFVELRMPNYDACGEVFLKVPVEDTAGCEWSIFAKELGSFAKKKVVMGDLEMNTQGDVRSSKKDGSRS